MDQTLVQKLKPWVTTFSAGIHKNYKSGDEVCVGGVIEEIFDTTSFMAPLAPKGERRPSVQVILDDAIGKTELLFMEDHYTLFNNNHHFEQGMIVLAKGMVWEEGNKHPEQECDTTIACWMMWPLPK
jgi:hypothetical protein